MKYTIFPHTYIRGISWKALVVQSVIIMIFFLFLTLDIQTHAAGSNLVANPSMEQINPSDPTLPMNWVKGQWGTSTSTFTYPVAGQNGTRAGKVQTTSHTSGDAKWAFDRISVIPGTTYQFSNYYKSDATTELVIEYKKTDNTFSYVSLGAIPAATDWTMVSKSFTVPTGVQSATVFHLLKSVGTLTIDTASLSVESAGSTPPPPSPTSATGNIISNPSLEIASPSNASIPLDWNTGSWGTNTASFTYPTAGQESAKGVRVDLTSYTSGDAKWYFKHVPVTPGNTYVFSDHYQSNVASTVTLEYKNSAGNFSYVNLGTLPAATAWKSYTGTFVPPANTVTVSVFHYINTVGYLNTDSFVLLPPTGTGSTWTGSIDTIVPTVSLTAPTANNTLSGTIQLRATATDNVGISSVTFFIDNIAVGAGTVGSGSISSYILLLDSAPLMNGTHTVHVEAIDTSNNSLSTASIPVTIYNPIPDIEAPLVSITSPTKWAILSGTSTLSISATDNIGVASVHYSVTNGVDMIVGQLSMVPYTVVIPANALKNGLHTITVYGQDAAGNIWNATPVIYNTYYVPPTPPNPNLILNPSIETGAGGVPDHWAKGGWGTNTATFSYPVAGVDGVNAAEVSMNTRIDGDAKWYFDDVAVASGQTYTFSDQYKSTTTSTLTVRYTNADGTFAYLDIVSDLPVSSGWITASQTITVPANAVKATVFHLINRTGSLSIDNAEFRLSSSESSSGPLDPDAFPTGLVSLTFDDGWGSQYDSALPMLNSAGIKGSFYIITDEMKNAVNANRIGNPSFEVADSATVPSGWTGSVTGINDATFSYPVTGVSGGKAAKVDITSYTSGDAKWQPDDTTVVNGEIYNFTDQYISDVPTKVTVVYTLTDDTTQAFDLGTVPAALNWSVVSFTFTPPVNTKTLTVYHRLMSIGTLTTDDYHLDIAQDYMNLSQIRDIYNGGHEVGAHSRTHPFLTGLTGTQALDEISGARQDMLAAGFTPSDTFVYPYGDYNSWTIQMTKDAGYIGARSVDQGYNTQASNKYALMVQEINSSTTAAQWESWTQTAMKNHTWLILMFHQIDHQLDEYGATPENLRSYIDYIETKGIPTVTIWQGIRMMNP